MGNKDDAPYKEEDKDSDMGSMAGWSDPAMGQSRPEYDAGCCDDWGSSEVDELNILAKNPPLLGTLPLEVELLLVVAVAVAVAVATAAVVAAMVVATEVVKAAGPGGGCN